MGQFVIFLRLECVGCSKLYSAWVILVQGLVCGLFEGGLRGER